MHKRKLILASLAALALPLAAHAQTRTRRTPAPKTTVSRPVSPRSAPSAATPNGRYNLTATDMALVIEGLNFDPRALDELASSAESRKSFATDVRRMLAAAAEARADGYAERPDIKLQLELARSFVLAQTYFNRRQGEGVKDPEQIVSASEIDAFLSEPATAAKLDAFVADYVKSGPGHGTPVTDAQRKELSRQYGRVMLGMRKGVAAGIERERKTQLAVMLQQSRLLAGAYAKETAARFKATDAEVDAYISKHPELDTKAVRAKAEDILRRVRAGEDFATLAREFSEDPGSRAQGGDLGWFGRGVMVKPFEEAAFALKAGEVSGLVESPFGFHIVKLEERRGGQGGAPDEVHARHILVGYPAPSDPTSPRMNPRDRARASVERDKRDLALDALAARNHVSVPDDYPIGPGATSREIEQGVPRPSGETHASTKPAAQPQPNAKPKATTPARRTHARRGH